ncbi:alpha/beta hydrolase [Tenggerimyces flavus]|uniref:Alpha/beta hydrolase n=1 Tax=Tenggerimyces flavus TaxID=1708749 RepID=A0ABV7YIQ2_9ACTN|nr:alpha/beta hydrolase [Tenggerimyces flavus]MBM7789184.1 pimeloyl-ACP methyl ester carboxylesterase [Tenggerimyces flavus]
MRGRVGAVAAAVGALVVGLLPALPAAAADSITWKPCPEPGGSIGQECAKIPVPLDYRKPDGKTIEVAVSRLRSTNPAKRRGVLLVNPGGPGGPGQTMPLDLVSLGLPVSVMDTYDLIGFDPRGTGESTPVTCDIPPAEVQSNVPPYARNPADVAAHAEALKPLPAQCAASSTGALLPFVNTSNTARDMDRIRVALGESKISYFGVSYGSYLGAAYASMFPSRVDRVVLDSVTGPAGLDYQGSRWFATGFDIRFPDFAKWAAARDATYELGATPGQVRRTYFSLAARLDQTPIQGVDGALFRAATFSWLYNDASFPTMAQAWQQLLRAPSAAAAASVAAAIDPLENYVSSQLLVVCNDSDWPESVSTYQRVVERERLARPAFGPAAANIWACAFWPVERYEPPVRVNGKAADRMLLVENLRDPATPLVGTLEMKRAFGRQARLVTVDQGGHGVYLFGENACANNTVTTYLVTGKRPRAGLHCPKDGGLFGASSQDQAERREALRQLQRGFVH